MKQLVLKLDVNDEQVLKIALDRIRRTSGNYTTNMDMTTKLCTVTGDNIDPIQIVRKLRMLCPVYMVAVETPKEPEKKKEELVEEVVNASSLAAAVGPSKEPKKEDELRKEEPTKQEELVEEVVNASSRAAAAGPSKEPKKKEEELEEEEPKKQEEKKKGEELEELVTDVKVDPNKTFRARQMKKAVLKLELHDEDAKSNAMKTVCVLPGVDSISMDMKDKKMTVIGDIDAAQIETTLKKLCSTEIISIGPAEEPGDPVVELFKAYKSYMVAVETLKDPEKKKEELVEEVVNASLRAAAVGPSKEPEKEDELRKEEPTKQEELVEEVVNASLRAAAVGPSKEPEKEDELRKEEPTKQEELVEEVVNVSSHAAAVGPSKEPKKEEEPEKVEEKKKGEELLTDVKDPNKTFRARQMTMKAVLKVELHDEKGKKTAMKKVSGLPGVESVSIEMKDKKMTVTGDVDPVNIVAKLRKLCHTEIITVGPAKEPEKKKEEPKKGDPADPLANYLSYHPQMPPYYYVSRVEDNPNACVIS
ncbi:hypothetical protein SADUNF_Sadunf17G0133800 [Salix dunnii]|uniref:HMA domain-containing protein n=1 Tax=Salix dunnii TaxID=1413687 RepID=A0A835J8Z5_9ROSI|nr:hypothetical protein SADUNF_Sadunf17G0133800 [Salix dunnii]